LPATGVVDAATWNALEGKAINTSAPTTVEGVTAVAPNTEVSPQQLIDIAAGGGFTLSPERAAEVAPFVSEAMQIAGIDTVNDKAAFVAQLMHESAAFRYNEEIHDGSNYEGRRDLGNTQPGDGRRFKGRGFIQLTGRANYEAASRDLGIDFVNNPDLAANDANAAKVAAWYWQQRNISVYGDAGDIVKVSKLVNGGTNGLEQRKELFYAGVEIFENAPLADLGNGHVHHPVLDVIRGELGVSEATGRNDGIPQERYSQGRKDPWCAHFVAWAFRQTGAPLPGDRPLSQNQNLALGSVQHMEDQMRAAGTLVPGGKDATPQPGDVIFFASRGRSDSGSGRHVGIVEKVENGRVHTIEGNSSNSVRRRSYPLDHYNIANYGRPSLHQSGAQDGFVVPTPIFESEFNEAERSPAPRSPAPRARRQNGPRAQQVFGTKVAISFVHTKLFRRLSSWFLFTPPLHATPAPPN